MLLFFSSFFDVDKGVFVFVCFLSFVSPLTHLNLFVCSVSHSADSLSVFFYLCGWLSGGHQVHLPPCGFGLGSLCCVTTPLNSLSLFSLYAVVATHFDLVCSSDASFFFLPYSRHNKMTLGWLPTMIRNCLPIGLFVVCVLLHGKGILHLFNNVALLSSSYSVNRSERWLCGCGLVWCYSGFDWTVRENLCKVNQTCCKKK